MDNHFSKSDAALQINEGFGHSPVSHGVNILELLDGMVFPASKMELIAFAEDKDTSEEAMDQLQAIPDDIYNSLPDVSRHANEIEIIEGGPNLWSSEESHDLPDETERALSDLNGQGRV
ncbi:MAG: hypothetical protein JWO78_570 [Micavibrio sp.]|nr:hypothetical protein [Micavibrio sp.]